MNYHNLYVTVPDDVNTPTHQKCVYSFSAAQLLDSATLFDDLFGDKADHVRSLVAERIAGVEESHLRAEADRLKWEVHQSELCNADWQVAGKTWHFMYTALMAMDFESDAPEWAAIKSIIANPDKSLSAHHIEDAL